MEKGKAGFLLLQFATGQVWGESLASRVPCCRKVVRNAANQIYQVPSNESTPWWRQGNSDTSQDNMMSFLWGRWAERSTFFKKMLHFPTCKYWSLTSCFLSDLIIFFTCWKLTVITSSNASFSLTKSTLYSMGFCFASLKILLKPPQVFFIPTRTPYWIWLSSLPV